MSFWNFSFLRLQQSHYHIFRLVALKSYKTCFKLMFRSGSNSLMTVSKTNESIPNICIINHYKIPQT